jgi:hypothetical protein
MLTVLVLVIGTSASAFACPRGHDRPFLATASGQVAYDGSNPSGCAAPWTTLVTASGWASHLGRVTVSASHCEVPSGPDSGQSVNGRMTLTAANGDTITGTYVTAWVFQDGKVNVTGWLDVAGGTGRFADATGRLWQHHVISVVAQTPPWPVQMGFWGRIHY